MASQKQIEANRRNALKSTGPKTDEGKAAVSMNALRYGLRARSILIPGENPEEYDRLCASLEAEWRPRNTTERLLLEQMVTAQWKLARLEVGERSIYMQTMAADKQMALLDRFSVQRGRLERSFSKAVHELEHLRKSRLIGEDRPAEVAQEILVAAAERQNPAGAPEFTYVMADCEPSRPAVPLFAAASSQPGVDH